jgi:hypothetical protein
MCDRVRWWDEYDEGIPVVIGYYRVNPPETRDIEDSD